MSSSTTSNRETFSTSRQLEYFSRSELTAQTGHPPDDWPLVTLKELIDNALDACEEAGVAPRIEAQLGPGHITVSDNGPGLPADTVTGVLDFSVRVSSREAYVEPTRGRQGNALKTVVAMPFVLDGEHGRVAIEARGIRHKISVRLDRIHQEPVIDHEQSEADTGGGTTIRVEWPVSFIIENAKARFLQIAEDYAWLNPHIALRINGLGEQRVCEPTDTEWRKWTPAQPPTPHWYGPQEFEKLIAACIAQDEAAGRDRTMREFVAGFKGFSSPAKQKRVSEAAGLAGVRLSDLVHDGDLDEQRVRALLDAMHAHSKVEKPRTLGVIGREHFRQRCAEAGCEVDAFRYKKVERSDEGVPSVVEVAFAPHGGALEPDADAIATRRRLITGINWSPGLINPFRELGEAGESLDSLLADQWASRREPVLVVLHAACPRIQYADRGKSSILLNREDDDDESQ